MSDDAYKRTTDWTEYTDHGTRYRVRATVGWTILGSQEPYFSVTGEEQVFEPSPDPERAAMGKGRWTESAGGMLHDLLAKRVPEVRPLLPFHLVFQKKGPTHYKANALWWWQLITGGREGKDTDPDPMVAFNSTVLMGALDEDFDMAQGVEDRPGLQHGFLQLIEIEDWLDERLPRLMAEFTRTMRQHGFLDAENNIQRQDEESDEIEEPLSAIEEFANRANISFESGERRVEDDMQCYTCTLSRDDASMEFPVKLGMAYDEPPSMDQAVSLLIIDMVDVEDDSEFEEWAEMWGFDTDSREAERAFEAVKEQRRQLHMLLGDDLLYELLNEVEREI